VEKQKYLRKLTSKRVNNPIYKWADELSSSQKNCKWLINA
jgi:hypothetical protein